MRQFLSSAWRWISTSAYTRFLESEVDRLRAENRALFDSLLSQAGVPPLTKPEFKQLPRPKGKLLPSQFRAKLEAMAMPREEKDGQN